MRQDSMCSNSCLSEVVILFLHRELFLNFSNIWNRNQPKGFNWNNIELEDFFMRSAQT